MDIVSLVGRDDLGGTLCLPPSLCLPDSTKLYIPSYDNQKASFLNFKKLKNTAILLGGASLRLMSTYSWYRARVAPMRTYPKYGDGLF